MSHYNALAITSLVLAGALAGIGMLRGTPVPDIIALVGLFTTIAGTVIGRDSGK